MLLWQKRKHLRNCSQYSPRLQKSKSDPAKCTLLQHYRLALEHYLHPIYNPGRLFRPAWVDPVLITNQILWHTFVFFFLNYSITSHTSIICCETPALSTNVLHSHLLLLYTAQGQLLQAHLQCSTLLILHFHCF